MTDRILPVAAPPRATDMAGWLEQNRKEGAAGAARQESETDE